MRNKFIRLSGAGVAIAIAVISNTSSRSANAAVPPQGWDSNHNPTWMMPTYEAHLNLLPMEASLPAANTPWSDTYWPSDHGGIAFRWNTPNPQGFGYRLHSLAELKAMTTNEVATLSPAEKYDIYMGRYDYPLVARERSRTSPYAADWEGICHGWSPASLHNPEPMPNYVANRDGIIIPFGSSDIKALLSVFYAYASFDNIGHYRFIGTRCQSLPRRGLGRIFRRPDGTCIGANPGAFHLALGNMIGLTKQGFVADLNRNLQVWNQPVLGYKSQMGRMHGASRRAAPSAVSEIEVITTMFYTSEIEPTFEPVVGTEAQKIENEEYHYTIELNGQGEIVGGEWLNNNHPDFIWSVDKIEFNEVTGSVDFTGIKDIYRTAAQMPPAPIPNPAPAPSPVPHL
ncbi:MAG: hypothetical protein H7222_09615 [Methylotenera sp.]|nr:hypothetical protein [Oligoflexia bacterium]